MVEKLGVAEAVAALRTELVQALRQGDGEPVQFGVKEVELELEVAVTVGGGAKVEAKWWVISFGADGKAERAGTHKVKLTLTPLVYGQDMRISSQQTSRD